jgi:hypothetical protein
MDKNRTPIRNETSSFTQVAPGGGFAPERQALSIEALSAKESVIHAHKLASVPREAACQLLDRYAFGNASQALGQALTVLNGRGRIESIRGDFSPT